MRVKINAAGFHGLGAQHIVVKVHFGDPAVTGTDYGNHCRYDYLCQQ